MDYFLSFPDEAAARSVLYRTEGAVEADPENGIEAREGYEMPNYMNIDTIGVIYKPTGTFVETEDGPQPNMEPIPNWHVNIRLMPGENAAALEPFAVTPKTPVRVWAG